MTQIAWIVPGVRRLAAGLLSVWMAALLGAAAIPPAAAAPRAPQPVISWSLGQLNVSAVPGRPTDVSVTFVSNTNLNGAKLSLAKSVSRLVKIISPRLGKVTANQPVTVALRITLPAKGNSRTISGKLELVLGRTTLRSALPLALTPGVVQPTPPPVTPTPPPAGPTRGGVYDELQVVYLTNLKRRAHGLGPLRANWRLTQAARWFAVDSVEQRPTPYCGHTDSQGKAFFDRTQRFGYPGFADAENAYLLRICYAGGGGERLVQREAAAGRSPPEYP